MHRCQMIASTPLRASTHFVKTFVGCAPAQPLRTQRAKVVAIASSTRRLRCIDSVRLSSWGPNHGSCYAGGIGTRNQSLSTAAVTAHCDGPSDDIDDVDDASTNHNRWENMYEALIQYKAEHGNTLVPATYPENPSLGNWVDNHRQWYRMKLEYEKLGEDVSINKSRAGVMTDEKEAKLNAIGFIWNVNEYMWQLRYQDLKEYIAEHGNALVPHNYPENEPLAVWVTRQRRSYKLRQDEEKERGREVTLSDERIEKLNAVGFCFDYHEAQWLERLEELKVYRSNYGDTLVPKSYEGALARWVDKQRMDYKRYMAKKKVDEEYGDTEILDEEVRRAVETIRSKPTGMTEERIRLLEAEDFIWDPREFAWEEKFAELCTFVQLNGHAAVFRKKGKPYSPLAGWADTQRSNYRKYRNGQKTVLTEERIARLNAVNFVWEKRQRAKSATKRADSMLSDMVVL